MSGTLIDTERVILSDPFVVVDTEGDLPDITIDVIVPLPRYLSERDGLIARTGTLGVAVAPEDDVRALDGLLEHVGLVTLKFRHFRDGRAYSQARILRDELRFEGRLRAVGDVLYDQLFAMRRCGFDQFGLADGVSPEQALQHAFTPFSTAYQPAQDDVRGVLFEQPNSVVAEGGVAPVQVEASMGAGIAQTKLTPDMVDLDDLETRSAEELVGFALAGYGRRAAIGTSFQHSGLILLDMATLSGLPFRVFTLDTLRLPPESCAHIEAVEAHFGIEVERVTPDPDAVADMVTRHGEYLFFDSVSKRQWCCAVRKDQPNERVMQGLDCWITGTRRDQSETRRSTRKAAFIDKYGHPTLKLAPLADWTGQQVREYVARRGIPVNPLFDKGYKSLGCTVCSTPVLPWEEERAGRWRWEKDAAAKECGLHLKDGAGI
jgi:phosphoadenosine phosphosulfate reductase